MNNCLINDPDLSDKLKRKIIEIGDCIKETRESDVSLFNGKAGIAIFWAYYSEIMDNVDTDKILPTIVYEIFDRIKSGNVSYSFAEGGAGIGWVIEHLKQKEYIDFDSGKFMSWLDSLLYPKMIKELRDGHYDFLHGALGLAWYFFNHPPYSDTRTYIVKLVDELRKKGKSLKHGIAWESRMYNNGKEKVYNLSLSHGIASIIVILSRLYEANIAKEEISELIEGAVDYLLHYKQDPLSSRYLYPSWISKKKSKQNKDGRLAWCYNDLGISLSLLQAGQIFDNVEWRQEAINTLTHTTNILGLEEAGVKDAGLCHGTSGIAHLYHRAYKYTGIEKYKETAIYWLNETLRLATYSDGLAGYKTYRTPEFGGIQNNTCFLEGIAGIALSFIPFISEVEPSWDRALLLS